jgi:hypothetical protein
LPFTTSRVGCSAAVIFDVQRPTTVFPSFRVASLLKAATLQAKVFVFALEVFKVEDERKKQKDRLKMCIFCILTSSLLVQYFKVSRFNPKEAPKKQNMVHKSNGSSRENGPRAQEGVEHYLADFVALYIALASLRFPGITIQLLFLGVQLEAD